MKGARAARATIVSGGTTGGGASPPGTAEASIGAGEASLRGDEPSPPAAAPGSPRFGTDPEPLDAGTLPPDPVCTPASGAGAAGSSLAELGATAPVAAPGLGAG